MSLFRPEVQKANSAQWLGTVRLAQPVSYALTVTISLGLAALLLCFASWGDVTRKVRIAGVLVPVGGTLNITSPQAGVIADRRVQEGDSVPAGAVLVVLDTERQSAQGTGIGATSAQAAEQIALRQQSLTAERSLRKQQNHQRHQALTERVGTIDMQLRYAGEEIALLQRRVELSRANLGRTQQLAVEGFVSDTQVQTKLDEQLDVNGRLQALLRTRLGLQQDRQALLGEQQVQQAQFDTDDAQLVRSQSNLRQDASENAARRSTAITAPTGAQPATVRYRVTAMNLQPGQAVQAGQTLATLVAEQPGSETSPLEAQLFAPSRTAGFLEKGQSVYLRYAAYPYQKFGLHTGRIVSVSATPLAVLELPPNLAQQLTAQIGSTEALYQIRVRLDDQTVMSQGRSFNLKAGLSLDADILQETRKIWEWVLEPILSARAQLKILGAEPKAVSQVGH